jgi:Holliday junction resolvase RusA-like endonuclease
MTNSVSFTVEGVPRAKDYKIVKNKLYKSCECATFEWHVGLCAKVAMAGRPKLEGAIGLTLYIFIYSSKPLESRKSLYCTNKPDCTNVLKSVEDGMKNICFKDDQWVAQQRVTKYWCFYKKEERVTVYVESL